MPHRTSRRPRPAVLRSAAVAVTLLLAACGGADDPTVETTPSASEPAATSSPTTTPTGQASSEPTAEPTTAAPMFLSGAVVGPLRMQAEATPTQLVDVWGEADDVFEDACAELAGDGWDQYTWGDLTVGFMDGNVVGWTLSGDGDLPDGVTLVGPMLGATIAEVEADLQRVDEVGYLDSFGFTYVTGEARERSGIANWWADAEELDRDAIVTLVFAGQALCE